MEQPWRRDFSRRGGGAWTFTLTVTVTVPVAPLQVPRRPSQSPQADTAAPAFKPSWPGESESLLGDTFIQLDCASDSELSSRRSQAGPAP